jgi:prepilin-type N-terminal cleavage/methylation domain-containing protein
MSLSLDRDREGGFTLIELLVVIAIIGILSSVVLASLNSARESSRDARRQTDLQQISLAMELYYDSCGRYPGSLDTSASDGCSGSTTFGDFMGTIPTDPQDDSDYGYDATDSSGESYCLGASLEGSDTPDNHVASCVSGTGDPDIGGSFNYAISP